MSTSNPPVFSPAGWYPDPHELADLRWWNGTEWTDRVETIRPEIHVAAGSTPLLHAPRLWD